jgi:GTP cyclohydrolase I
MSLDKRALDDYITGKNDPNAPFNQQDFDIDSPEAALKYILQETAQENIYREGLVQTPDRYIKFLRQFLNPEKFNFTTFEADTDEMVIVKNIPFYSLCEHHLAPFFGVGHIGYIPGDRIVGLSKIPRVLDMFARRLQNQERITKQVSEYLMEHLKPKGVAVILQARHLCMEMRGVEKPGAETTTSAMVGRFKENVNTRQEFLNLIKP